MTSPQPTPVKYRFGMFELDPSTGELLRKGTRVRLQDQPFRLLLLLVQNAGEVVTREEVRTQLWTEDTFVEFDNSLNVAVRKLRDALRDDADAPVYVETVPRRGYRFVAPVEMVGERERPTEAAVAETPSGTAEGERLRRQWWGYGWAVGLTLVVAAALVAWRTHQPVTQPVTGPKREVIIADFVNSTGEHVFDDSLGAALETGVRQSSYLDVVSRRETLGILTQMGRSTAPITGAVALEVCQRASAQAVIQGTIQNIGNRYVIGLQALRCSDGAVLASDQAQPARKEDVVATLGRTTGLLRSRLGESLQLIEEREKPLELLTTPSLEALKALNDGFAAWDKKGDFAAIPLFEKAVELDPKFASAYGALATVYHNIGEKELARRDTEKAYELRDRLPEPERLLVEARYSVYVTGDLNAAAQVYELRRQKRLNPAGTLNNLGSIYSALARHEEALQAFREALKADPNRSITYGNLALALLALNRPQEAHEAMVEADSRGLRSAHLLRTEYVYAFLQRDAAERQKLLLKTSDVSGAESSMLSTQATTEAYFGRLRKAREFTEVTVQLFLHEGGKESAALRIAQTAAYEAIAGESAAAKTMAAKALKLSPGQDVRVAAAVAFAVSGETKQAEQLAAKLDEDNPQNTLMQRYWLPALRAHIALAHGNTSEALTQANTTMPLDLSVAPTSPELAMYPTYVRGLTYLQAGDAEHAAAEFQAILDHPGVILNCPLGSVAHLWLARAQRKAGQRDKARREYENFLSLWKDADAAVPALVQARKEQASDRNFESR
jgi:eukaryotic-like serine/threonine-protein kinase